jgi:hypothetical protein
VTTDRVIQTSTKVHLYKFLITTGICLEVSRVSYCDIINEKAPQLDKRRIVQLTGQAVELTVDTSSNKKKPSSG